MKLANGPPKTTLTAWFTANEESSIGHDLLYHDFPGRFSFNKSTKKWKLRPKGQINMYYKYIIHHIKQMI